MVGTWSSSNSLFPRLYFFKMSPRIQDVIKFEEKKNEQQRQTDVEDTFKNMQEVYLRMYIYTCIKEFEALERVSENIYQFKKVSVREREQEGYSRRWSKSV